MDRQGIFDYAKRQYGTEPEYLWLRYPSYAVLRHPENRKWYGIVMDVPREKLGLPGAGSADILDVKGEALAIDLLRQSPGFLPAYHMNKKYWVSILLDGSVPDDTVLALLDRSFHATEN